MKNNVKNPLTVLLLSFFISACAFSYCNATVKISAIFVAVIAVILIILIERIKRRKLAFSRIVAFIMLGTVLSGALSVYAFDYRAEKISRFAESMDTVTIKITDCDYALSYTARYTAKIVSSDLLSSGTSILITTEMTGLKDGTLLRGEVVYSSLESMNDSTFNAKNYYLPKKIMTYAEAVSLEVIGEDGSFSLSGMFRDINESLTAKITAHSSAVNGGLQAAVLLGNKDHLSDVTVRDFRRLGISHLLVVSGMHFAIIVSFIERTLRRLRINKRYRAIFNMFFIVFIMALMGFTPSVTRAGIMCLLAQLVQLTSRRFDQLTSLALAGTVMIISNPYIALDCGMQLSFISTYSCLVFVRFRSYFILKARRRGKKRSRPSKLLRFMRSIMETVLLTLFVNLSILPITYLYFGEISLMAIPANIIFIPAITILMYLTAVYLILYPLRIFIIPLSTAIGWYCNLIESIASALSELNFSIVAINYSWCVLFIIPITLLIFVFPYVSKKNIKRVGVVLISAIFLFGVSVTAVKVLERDDVTVSYVSENKNDGIVVKSNGKIMLCDFSDASFGFSKEMLTEMTELHVTEIDAVLFTHYHSKHVQLLNRLSDREIVRSIILTEPINETEYTVYDSLYKTALSKGIVVYSVSAGEVFEFEDTEIFIFERKYISRSTHPITALQISAYGESVTYASGSFNQSVAEIMDSLETSEHVILGRHSPVYKKEFELNFDITPASVVISNDSYNHMSEDTQDYVNSVGALIDVDGYRLIIKRKE